MNDKCKICGTSTRKITHEKTGNKFFCCNNCDFIAKDEQASLSLQDEFCVYERHNNSIDDPKYNDFFKVFIAAAVEGFLGKERNGCDFGSGPSPVLAMILERDYNCKIDIYDKFYSPNKIYQGKKYNFITSTEVVEHLDNPLEYFRLFSQLIKDDGFISIMTLFHPKDDEKFADWFYIRDNSHTSFFTPKTMEYIANLTSLKVVFCNNHRFITFKKNTNKSTHS